MEPPLTDFQDQLFKGLTHKMNNILSLFSGYVSLLLEEKGLNAQTERGLARIREGALAASDLMDRTYSLTKPNSVELRTVELSEFFEYFLPTLEGNCERGVRLKLIGKKSVGPLETNLMRLRTIIGEVVRNACEASPPKGVVEIETGLTVGPTGEEQVFIAVSDRGPGVPKEFETRIFEPFFTTRINRTASGLGLAVAQVLAQQIGSTWRYERTEGRTTFRLLLPAGERPVLAAAA